MANILGGIWLATLNAVNDLIVDKPAKIRSLDLVFKLHSTVTFTLFLLLSGLLQLVKFSGSFIDCKSRTAKSLQKFAASHCWIKGTYIQRNFTAWHDTATIYGLGPDVCEPEERRESDFWLDYYQWSAWVLLVQAFTFYFPRWIWWNFEIGVLGSTVKALSDIGNHTEKKNRKEIAVISQDVVQRSSYYAWIGGIFIALEGLNFFVTICQIRFLNFFLGTFSVLKDHSSLNELSFSNLGLAFIEYWTHGQWGMGKIKLSPGAFLFPRRSRCSLMLFERGGMPRKECFLCFLFLNNINEKAFTLLWFWLHGLAIVAGLKFLYSIITACFGTSLESKRLKAGCNRTREDMMDMEENPHGIRILKSTSFPFGLRYFLKLAKQNARFDVFKEFMIQISSHLSAKTKEA